VDTSIYNYTSYTAYLKDKVKAEKPAWGAWGRLAKAAGCQPTYLSQALKSKCNLTQDQILGIAVYWNLSNDETDFFMLLLELERAGTRSLKNYLKSKIDKIRSDQEDIAKRLSKPRVELGEKETLYYSSWYWSALHIIVTIPKFQTASAIAQKLMLPQDLVTYSLEVLEKHGIVRKDGGLWKLGTADVHLPKSSPIIGIHHNNWRQKAVLDSTNPHSEGTHYTAVYSISQKDYQHLKEKMLDIIEYSRKVVGPSNEEELICFACDLFKV